jgi:(p)ppGpp synthase/HD superfamily hydrolase
MNSYAQTNLQLYGQMLEADRREADLRLVRDAYQLALGLFAGHYRGNGKPFLSHLVGVASILVAHGHEIETIVAGLLHSAYSLGEFGDGTRGPSPRKQREVGQVVGSAVEELVAEYTLTDWDAAVTSARQSGSIVEKPICRQVVQIKIADVLEDHLDQGLAYVPAKLLMSGTDNRASTQGLLNLAEQAGAAAIAVELQARMDEAPAQPVPDYLVNPRAGGSIVIAPRSHRERIAARMTRKISRWLKKRRLAA